MTVEIEVPAYTAPGERYGVIWAQTRSKPRSDGVAQMPGGHSVITVRHWATEPVLVRLDQERPDGPWATKLRTKSAVTSRTAQARLTFPAAPGQKPAVPADHLPVTWWMIVFGVVFLLLLILLGVAARVVRRSRKRGASVST